MAEKTFIDRIVAAFAEMPNPPLDSKNPHFGNRFASLLAVSNVVRPALANHQLAYRQTVELVNGNALVTTIVYGKSDNPEDDCDYIRLASVPIKVVDNPQQMGSALTYAKRYCLLAAFGLVGDEDDDAEAATAPARKAAKKASKPKAATPPKPTPTDAEKVELAEIAKALGGDKGAVWAAFQANGIEGARALVTINPAQVELFGNDQAF